MTHYEHEREHYRIEYPTAARPRFLVAGEDVVRVIDSRGGAAAERRGSAPGVLEEQRYIRERHRGSGW